MTGHEPGELPARYKPISDISAPSIESVEKKPYEGLTPGTPEWMQVWREHPELQREMLEYAKRVRTEEVAPTAKPALVTPAPTPTKAPEAVEPSATLAQSAATGKALWQKTWADLQSTPPPEEILHDRKIHSAIRWALERMTYNKDANAPVFEGRLKGGAAAYHWLYEQERKAPDMVQVRGAANTDRITATIRRPYGTILVVADGSGYLRVSLDRTNQHAEAISKALSEGKPVPPEVLADYPDLAKQAQTTEVAKPASLLRVAPVTSGKTATVKTERGTAVDTEYAVVDANALISSHDTALRPDPRFLAELQPRERARAASEAQITRIANQLEPEFLAESPKASEGAPIIGKDMMVESGNARVIAIKKAYEERLPTGENYRKWLIENADRFGIDRSTIEGIKNPVLVRVRQTDVDRQQFVREANEAPTAAMSATEQALSDAKKLSGSLMQMFVPSEEGEISNVANREFIRGFMQEVVGPTEQGRYVTADGALSQEGIRRIQNAIFAKAYRDPSAIERLAESTDNNIRNITGAMLIAAPRYADIKERIEQGRLHNLDISSELSAAMNKLSELRERGESVERYLEQRSMFAEQDLNPIAKKLLWALSNYSKSRKKVAEFLGAYVDTVIAAGDPKQLVLFQGTKAPTKEEALEAALNVMEARYEKPDQASLFDYKTVGGQAPSKPGPAAGPGEAKEVQPSADKGKPSRVEKEVQKLSEEVNKEIEEVTPPVGLSVKITGKIPQKPVKGSKYAFSDPEIEERWQAAHGVPEPPLIARLKAIGTELYNKATREFEHLPRTAEFAPVRYKLLELQKQKDIASDTTLRLQQGITIKLNPESFDLFARKVILDDLEHEAKENRALPFGFTPESLQKEKAAIDKAVEGNPDVKDAIEKRSKTWKAIKDDYVDAMEAIGFHVKDRLKKEDYFRHQVLEYAQARSLRGPGRKLRTPTGRGFLKEREGSELDINTNYLQAEYEVMAQMLRDTEIAKTIKFIDDNYNIQERLNDQAKGANQAQLFELVKAEMPQMPLGKEFEPHSLVEILKADVPLGEKGEMLRGFRKRIAIGISGLRKLAEQGALVGGENGEFDEVVESLKEEQGWIREAINEDIPISEVAPGGPYDENSREFFQYISWLFNQNIVGSKEAGSILKAVSERREWIKDTLGDKYVTWRDLIPEGYTTWQPREGNIFFLTDSIPAKLAAMLNDEVLEKIGISKEDLHKVLAMGGPRKEFVLKQEIADTLDNLTKPPDTGILARGTKAIQKVWKVNVLVAPRRWYKYNARNLSGDADHVFVGNPSAFRKIPQAIYELYQVFAGDRAMTDEMKEWYKRGGMQTLLQVQELGDIDRLRMFMHLQETKGTWKELPIRAWQTYWKTARLSTDFREAILRYAAYLDYFEQMQKDPNGRPKNFGASIPEEIMALDDIRDRAFVLSNQLLGAYDQVSALGQEIREHIAPFWSWQEVNFKWYLQALRNAARDPRGAATVGRLFGAKAPRLAYNIGKFVLKAVGLWTLFEVWNHIFFPDEERDLPPEVQGGPHIIFGRDKDGKVKYFDKLGALQDFLDWFGMDEAPNRVMDFLNGKRTLKEIATDMVKSPINKLVQAVTPLIKTPMEALTRRNLFPDVFKPGAVRDVGLHIARGLGLEPEYRVIAGLPSRGYLESWQDIFYYRADPGESAYYAILDEKTRFMKKIGKANQVYATSPRSNALYNLKLALRYGDKKAADHYLQEYLVLGGTRDGLEQSLNALDPLYGLSKEEQRAFIQSLAPEDQYRFEQAVRFYKEVLSKAEALNVSILPRKKGAGGVRMHIPSMRTPKMKIPKF